MKMFRFLPFVFILSAVSFRTETEMTARFFSNPTAFVNSLATADQDTINKLIQYANELIVEGEGIRKDVIQARDEANKVAAAAGVKLNAANAFLTKAENEEQAARDDLRHKTTIEANAFKAMNAAEAHMKDSQQKLNRAQRTMDRELARIAEEHEDLEEVKELLDELMPVFIEKSLGRALLSEANSEIDPKSVQQVIQLVNQLMIAGQEEAKGYTKARDDAQDVLDAATQDYNNKYDFHTHALGAKSVAEEVLEQKVNQAKNALEARNDAQNNKNIKDGLAADAEAHRVAEEKRINEEKEMFEKVIQLLQKLLV